MENFTCLEVTALQYKLFKIRERAWQGYRLHLCWDTSTLILTSGLFLHIITRGLCIKMKNVVRTGAGIPICLFSDKYPHLWAYNYSYLPFFPWNILFLLSAPALGVRVESTAPSTLFYRLWQGHWLQSLMCVLTPVSHRWSVHMKGGQCCSHLVCLKRLISSQKESLWTRAQ